MERDDVKPIPVNKAKLRGIIQQNRDRHGTVFADALRGFQAERMKLLEAEIERARKGLAQNVYVSLQCPVDHTPDYDRVLGMLELSEGDTIELSEQDYSQYVEDNWSWKQQWSTSNAGFSGLVASTPGYAEYTQDANWD